MELKGTKTEQNLRLAFSGESEARNKYTYFSDVAKKNGYEQIAELFTYTANNEKEHAKIWFKLLNGISNDTTVNLSNAAASEHYEHSEMYQNFAKTAKEEGFDAIAKKFLEVAEIERHHEERFLKLLENINLKEVFAKSDVVIWECRNCGQIVVDVAAPSVCPVCAHAQSFYQIKAENY